MTLTVHLHFAQLASSCSPKKFERRVCALYVVVTSKVGFNLTLNLLLGLVEDLRLRASNQLRSRISSEHISVEEMHGRRSSVLASQK